MTCEQRSRKTADCDVASVLLFWKLYSTVSAISLSGYAAAPLLAPVVPREAAVRLVAVAETDLGPACVVP